jgi:hypothetical protein
VSPLWVVPLVILAVCAVIVALVARRLEAEIVALQPEVDGILDMREQVRGLITDAGAVRQHGTALEVRERMRAARPGRSDQGLGRIDR